MQDLKVQKCISDPIASHLALAFVSDLQVDLHVGLTSPSPLNLSLLEQQSI